MFLKIKRDQELMDSAEETLFPYYGHLVRLYALLWIQAAPSPFYSHCVQPVLKGWFFDTLNKAFECTITSEKYHLSWCRHNWTCGLYRGAGCDPHIEQTLDITQNNEESYRWVQSGSNNVRQIVAPSMSLAVQQRNMLWDSHKVNMAERR